MSTLNRILNLIFITALVAILACPAAQAQQYYWSNLAGMPGGSGILDGTGLTAQFNTPFSVAVDGSGTVYVADRGNHTIRKVTSSGMVTTLAGNPGVSGTSDGMGSAARFNSPWGVAVDGSGTLYVADNGNYTIRKITADGAVTTLAGNPGQYGIADGTGSAALFGCPSGIAVDGSSGNVYVADTDSNTIRKVTSTGVVTTFAGTAGQLGTADGTGSAAQFNQPNGVAVDGSGNVYVADTFNHSIRKISAAGVVTTFAGIPPIAGVLDGTGTQALFNFPHNVTVDASGNVFVADSSNHTIRKVTSAGVVTTLAGSAGAAGVADGIGTAARFNTPCGVAVDGSGMVYVADSYNNSIRKVTGDWGVVTTFVGSVSLAAATSGTGNAARFNIPNGVGVDASGNVYVADTNNSTIRKVTSTGVVTTLAGASAGLADGNGTAALFHNPRGIAVTSSTCIYVADTFNNVIRQVTLKGSTWTTTTVGGQITVGSGWGATSGGIPGRVDGTGTSAKFSNPSSIAADSSGVLYIADTYNHTIRQMTLSGTTWTVTTLTGTTAQTGTADGTGSAARFSSPLGIAVDSSSNVYVADSGNNTIRKMTVSGSNWTVTTLAGSPGVSGTADGIGRAARFNNPAGLSVDSDSNVYVADCDTSTIRKVSPNGTVVTLGGMPGAASSADGIGSAAMFNTPCGVAVSASGNIYIADSGNNRISMGSCAGTGTASLITGTEATVSATAFPNGVDSTANFQYGTSTSYTLASAEQDIGSGTDFVAVTADLTGLMANTTYHYRLQVVNANGTFYGTDQTFTTPPVVVPSITSAATATGTNGIVFSSYQITADNCATGFGASGLPPGLSVNPATGIIFGTPTAIGTFTATLSATNVVGTGTKALTLSISTLVMPSFTSGTTARGVADSAFSYNLAATPSVTSYSAAGMPTGLSFKTRTNAISGVPTASGTFTVTISATNLTGTTTVPLTIAISPPYSWAKLAGLDASAGSGDGNITSALGAAFAAPYGVATDRSGNIYVADNDNNTLRKVTPDGIVSTLAGTAGTAGTADGTGSAATFNGPEGIAVDGNGNIYVADNQSQTIRKVTPDGKVSTLAGKAGTSGTADGIGTAAQFSYPVGISVDSSGNNLYVADWFNSTIRKITFSASNGTWKTTTLAGSAGTASYADGTGNAAQFSYPTSTAVDANGNVYVADTNNEVIRKVTQAGVVTTIAGTALYTGSADGIGSSIRFYYPKFLAIDSSGTNLYITDYYNHLVRKLTYSAGTDTWTSTTMTNGGIPATFGSPDGIALDGSNNIYVADYSNNTLNKLTSGTMAVFAGIPGYMGSSDGVGISIMPPRLNSPFGTVTGSNGNFYIADAGNNTIREITPDGTVKTIAGTPAVSGATDGTGSAALFSSPYGISIDVSGNLYIADTSNNTIRKLTYSGGNWISSTLAGLAGTTGAGNANGVGTAARFNAPSGLALDASGNIYVADSGNQLVRKLTYTAGNWKASTLAGAGTSGTTDGNGIAAKFNGPNAVAVDSGSNVYVTDFYNCTIRKISPGGVVTTIAGTAGIGGAMDGVGNAAQFYNPNGVALDGDGNLYVADSNNLSIRKLTPFGTNWMVMTIGNSGHQGYSLSGVTVDRSGYVYVSNGAYCTIDIGAAILPPAITNPLTTGGTNDRAFNYAIIASNMPNTYACYTGGYNAIGLPPGLSINTATGVISGTNLVSGNYALTISATNLAGSATNTLPLTIWNSKSGWKKQIFSSVELSNSSISGDTAVPAGDGIPNLLKYALNLNPKTPSATGLPTRGMTTVNGTNYLTLTYTPAPLVSDITYTVEVSGDLQAWNSGPGFTTLVNTGTASNVTVQDTTPMNSAAKRFIRLKVTNP